MVLGLGRFGKSLALELMSQDTEVLGIDSDPKKVQSLAGRLTHVVEADSTSEEAMRQLSVHEFDRVVIGVGSNIENSILTASVVLTLGVPHVWAKAVSHAHARILSQLGVHHVVRPEHDTGRRVAHLVRGRMLDYIEFDDGYAIVKTKPPRSIHGVQLGESRVRSRYGVTIVGNASGQIASFDADMPVAAALAAADADRFSSGSYCSSTGLSATRNRTMPAVSISAPGETPQFCRMRAPTVAAVSAASAATAVPRTASSRLKAASRPCVSAANGAMTLNGPSIRNRKMKIFPSENSGS